MSLWMVHYAYDNRVDLRERLADEHKWYLAGLADAGAMIAHGNFADPDEPGALLIAQAPSAEHVEDLLAADPYVVAGAVADITVKPWNGKLVRSWPAQAEHGCPHTAS